MNNIFYKLEESKFYNEMYVTEYLNEKPNNFWSIDDLTSPQGYNVESYRRAKDFLKKNYPELMI
jgi:hypothetical protein